MHDPAYYKRELEKARFLRNLAADDCVQTIVQALREQRLRIELRIARRLCTLAKTWTLDGYARERARWIIDRDLHIARRQLVRIDEALRHAGATG